MLELQDITFKEDDRMILETEHLVFETAKNYLITGEAKSGKSLLMKIIGGITKPTTGRVLLQGKDLYGSFNKRALKNKIGFVFRDGVFISNLSILDNLMLPLKHLRTGSKDENVMSKISELFERFHINRNILHKRPADLGYSEKKIVNFIRAVIIEPEVYLINMPLFNLDFGDKKRMIPFLTDLKTGSNTVIMTTNNRSLLETIADEIIYFSKGRVVSICKPDEFFSSEDPEIKHFIAEDVG